MAKNRLIAISLLVVICSSVSACGIKDYFDRLGEKMPTYEKMKQRRANEAALSQPAGVIKHGEPATMARPQAPSVAPY